MPPRHRTSRYEHILIVVDLQGAFPVPRRILDGVRRLSRQFRVRVFTRFVNPSGSQFRRLLKMDSCEPGSADTALQISPGDDDIVMSKAGYGLSPAQVSRLKRLGVRRATVCGIDTDACVLAVMFSLFDAGIDCRAKPTLCWSGSGQRMHQAGLKILAHQFPAP
ncbi:MAG TPA: isochorismatase family protein [Opitutaceae bacterium]|nr:isochorismatase family protein [Opitutaceae bacterium]